MNHKGILPPAANLDVWLTNEKQYPWALTPEQAATLKAANEEREAAYRASLNRDSSRAHACCDQAVRYYGCVCSESWDCPIHGRTCYGSHE